MGNLKNMSQEQLDVVDEDDKVVGTAPRDECLEKGLLHRAIAVVIADQEEKNLVIQKRSSNKNWYPNYWTLSCTGHVRAGEDYENAAKRELEEELGLKDTGVHELFKILMPKFEYGRYVESEQVKVYEGKIASQQKITFDSSEIEEIKKVTEEELKVLMGEEGRGSFTPDALIVLDKYFSLKKMS